MWESMAKMIKLYIWILTKNIGATCTNLNENVGGMSEAIVMSEYTIPAKFGSIQCLVYH